MTLRTFMAQHGIGEGRGMAFARDAATGAALYKLLRSMEEQCAENLPDDVTALAVCSAQRSLPSLLEVIAQREADGSMDYITRRLAQTCKLRVKQQAVAYGFARDLRG